MADRASAEPADPSDFGVAWHRLGGASRRGAEAPALVAVAILAEDEKVERVLVGRFRAERAVMVLTTHGLLIVNGREWAPEIVVVTDIGSFDIEGWIDGRVATIRLTGGAEAHVFDSIRDTEIAAEMTAALRER